MSHVAIIDYGVGNLRSVEKAFAAMGCEAVVSGDESVLQSAERLVLPGVGAFASCMTALRARGFDSLVRERAAAGTPLLGICVGMQMLFDNSEEDEAAIGLGVIPGTIRWLGTQLPRPQMQWNRLTLTIPEDPMFAGLPEEAWVYFVHSLHAVPNDPSVVAATCSYGGEVNAAFRYGNVFATQFHPEKSGEWGIALLANFVRVCAEAAVS